MYRSHPAPRRALTLVEMLVAMVVTIIMIFSVVQVFSLIGENVAKGRAIIEMSGQLRSVAYRLEQDLAGLTAPVRPWLDPGANLGYFEYFEGLGRDDTEIKRKAGGATTANTTLGDVDDILMFTARNLEESYLGRLSGTMVDSKVAEIIWWTSFVDRNANNIWDQGEEINLHRRVLLIRPDIDLSGFTDPIAFFQANDISARFDGSKMVANTLGDLTKRENRFAHNSATFPHVINLALLRWPSRGSTGWPGWTGSAVTATAPASSLVRNGSFQGEDVALSHVLAFDVKAYDPEAALTSDGFHALTISDPGFAYWQSGGPPPPPPPPPGPPPPPEYIDDGQAGFTTVGSWSSATGTGFGYLNDRAFPATAGGNGSRVARFTFNVSGTGTYDVAVTWNGAPNGSNKAPNAPFRVLINGTPSPITVVNQQTPPNEFTANGVGWKRLGSFPVSGASTTIVVEVTDNVAANTYVIADAARIEKQPDPPTPPPTPTSISIGLGTFVDLNHGASVASFFSAPPTASSGLALAAGATYDTWSAHYEQDGIDQDGTLGIDQSRNGFDDNSNGGVDDPFETETSPPYSHPIRGLEVSIRILETDTNQVRQISIKNEAIGKN